MTRQTRPSWPTHQLVHLAYNWDLGQFRNFYDALPLTKSWISGKAENGGESIRLLSLSPQSAAMEGGLHQDVLSQWIGRNPFFCILYLNIILGAARATKMRRCRLCLGSTIWSRSWEANAFMEATSWNLFRWQTKKVNQIRTWYVLQLDARQWYKLWKGTRRRPVSTPWDAARCFQLGRHSGLNRKLPFQGLA